MTVSRFIHAFVFLFLQMGRSFSFSVTLVSYCPYPSCIHFVESIDSSLFGFIKCVCVVEVVEIICFQSNLQLGRTFRWSMHVLFSIVLCFYVLVFFSYLFVMVNAFFLFMSLFNKLDTLMC